MSIPQHIIEHNEIGIDHAENENLDFPNSGHIVQDDGWYVSNLTELRVLDVNTATLADLRKIVGTLITVLYSNDYKLLGETPILTDSLWDSTTDDWDSLSMNWDAN